MAGKRRRRSSKLAKAPGRYHHGDLREALVQTSIEIISNEGVEALTFREVARRLGVSHAAPRHHFADKAELLAAVAIEGFQALERTQREALEGITDPWERFKRIGVAYVHFAIDHPSQFRVMYGREIATASPSALRSYENAAAALMTETIAEALATRSGADAASLWLTSISAWSTVHGLAMLWLDGPLRQLRGRQTSEPEFKKIARQVADLIGDALARTT